MSRHFYFATFPAQALTGELSFRNLFSALCLSDDWLFRCRPRDAIAFPQLSSIDDFEKLTFLWQEWLRLTSCCRNV
jgi:hypothetical protein